MIPNKIEILMHHKCVFHLWFRLAWYWIPLGEDNDHKWMLDMLYFAYGNEKLIELTQSLCLIKLFRTLMSIKLGNLHLIVWLSLLLRTIINDDVPERYFDLWSLYGYKLVSCKYGMHLSYLKLNTLSHWFQISTAELEPKIRTLAVHLSSYLA